MKPTSRPRNLLNLQRLPSAFQQSSGHYHRASQGLFQILPRDNAPGQSEERQLFKTVRVVTTIEYRLGD